MDNPAALCYDGRRIEAGGESMTLGERLIQLRAKAGLSQDTLAEQLGVSRQSVSKWENDASVPDLEKLVKLSGVFGVSLDELVKGEGPDSAAPVVKVGVTAEELRLHRQRLLGLLLLLASVLLGARSEGTWGILFAWPLVTCGILCLLCRCPLGLLRGCILILSFRRNTYRQFYGAYRNRTIGGSDGLLASSSAIHTYMLVPIGGGLVSIPKYLVAFFRASRLFRPVPPFRTSSRWEISDAVLAGYAPAGRCLFFTDADLSSTSVQSLVRIVVYLKNISKRIPLN